MKAKRIDEIMSKLHHLPDEIYGIMSNKELVEICKMAKARKREVVAQAKARRKNILKPDEKFWLGKGD